MIYKACKFNCSDTLSLTLRSTNDSDVVAGDSNSGCNLYS